MQELCRSPNKTLAVTTHRVMAITGTMTTTMMMVVLTTPSMKLKIMTKASRPRRQSDSLDSCETDIGMCCVAA